MTQDEQRGEDQAAWVAWAQRLAAIAQNGLTFTKDPYDRERYLQVRSIAAEIMAHVSHHDFAMVSELLAAQQGYATPKVDLRAAVFRHDSVLLVREAESGLWSLPGGWADVCESAKDGVVREVLEETGYQVRVAKLAAVYDRAKHPHRPPFVFHVYKMFFVCELLAASAGEHAADPGIAEHGFFRLDQLPPLCHSRVLSSQIELCWAHHLDPLLPAYCD